MGRIIRYEYIGTPINSLYIFIAFLTVVGLPFAAIHLLQNLIRIEEDIENPSEFVEKFRAGKLPNNR